MSSDVVESVDRAVSPESGADPSRLGEYRLLREIGRGGMGVVYEAVQESLARPVALKVLPAGLAARGSYLERFRREARVAGRLHHTHIVAVYGVGEQHGSHFYAMQFIPGQGLDAVLQDVRRLRGLGAAAEAAPTSLRDAGAPLASESPPPGDPAPPTGGREELVGPSGAAYYRSAARLARQAAEALAYAHGQGVIHRDVKPSNLLIDWHGDLWVTDFGLAKADDAPDLTAPDDPVGTLRYMAPERFQGRADARSDVYSLGATLYEILTLRAAFDDDDRVRLIARIAQQAPSPPRKEAPDLPRDLETVVLKAMARDPADRYATAADLADDLRRFLEDRPVRARRVSALERLRRWRRRSPAVAALAFSVVGLLLLLAAGATVAAVWLAWQRGEVGRANIALEQTNARLGTANEALTAANGKLAEDRDQLFQDKSDLELKDAKLDRAMADQTDKYWLSLYHQARAGRFGPRPGRRLDSLAALAEARRIRPDDRLRTEAIACVALTDLKPGREWDGWPAGAFDMDFDGQLERYARADRHSAVSVRRTADDVEITHFTAGYDAPSWAELSPDGRFAAVRPDGASRRLQVWEVGEAPEQRIDEPSGVVAAAFSADSRRLAVLRTEGATDIDDLFTGQSILEIRTGPGSRAAAFRPDGRQLAVAGETAVAFYDPETGKRVAEWPMRCDALAWRPDGGLLAAAGRDQRIYFWDPAAGRLRAATPDPLAAGLRIAFDHAGDLLASCDASEMLRLWDPRTGRQLFATPSDTRALRFGSDDRRLAGEIDGGKLRMWEVAAGGEYRTLTVEPAGRDAPEFSGGAAITRDGRLLAAAMNDGVRLWDLASGEPCGFLPAGPTAAVAFDGDGPLLTHGTTMEAAVVRWPIRAEPDHTDGLRIGPPEPLPLRGGGPGLACSADGRVTAVATLRGVMVWRPDHSAEPIALQLHEDSRDDVSDVAVSPDGHWIAACSHSSKGVRVWEVETGVALPPIPVEGPAAAVFSPDGKWLAAGGKEDCHVWTVGSWEKGRRIDGAASAFAPDGSMLAVETGRGVVRLVDPQTGKIIAQLEDPNQDRSDVYFAPDGGRLVAVSLEGRCIHVWDLRRIRQGLAEIGLDWERPAYPPAPPPAAPPRVTAIGGTPR